MQQNVDLQQLLLHYARMIPAAHVDGWTLEARRFYALCLRAEDLPVGESLRDHVRQVNADAAELAEAMQDVADGDLQLGGIVPQPEPCVYIAVAVCFLVERKMRLATTRRRGRES